MMLIPYLYVGFLGACIGSFLSVVIHRLPRHESVVRPRSRCPQCRHRLAWRHNVPVVSYLWLRGRCAFCHAPIPRFYLVVEVGTVLVFVGLFQVVGWSLLLLRYATLAALLIAAAEIDRRHRIIPNRLLATGAGLALALASGTATLAVYVPAAFVSAGLLLLVRVVSIYAMGRPGMGMGDVKLAAVIGLFLGWESLWIFYLALVLGGLFGLTGLVTGRLGRWARLPFAPFMALAAGLHLFVVPPELVLPL